MKPRHFLTIGATALLFAGALPAAGAIYRTVDEDGNVVFTDVPPKETSKAVKLDNHNDYTPPAAETAPRNTGGTGWLADEDADQQDTAHPGYSSITIAHPGDDAAVRENAGNLTVTIESEPALDTNLGHSIEVLLDGESAATADGASVTLTNIDRGTHTLSANIVDSSGSVLGSSGTVTFHMLRYSQLNPPVKRAKK